MRLFFAVALPDAVRQKLAALEKDLREQAPKAPVSWVVPENIHLTLRFLGEVSDAKLPRVKDSGFGVAATVPRFSLVLEKVGTFGGKASPRVIWVGLRHDDGREKLAKIAEGLERAARKLGFQAEDRPFSAHATLGRVRDFKARRELEPLVSALEARKDFDAGTVNVESFVLYESRLQGPRPPEYVPVETYALQG